MRQGMPFAVSFSAAAGSTVCREVFLRQLRAVTHEEHRGIERSDLFRKLAQCDGSVLREALGFVIFYPEQGIIDLLSSCIHDRADVTACGKTVPCHCLEGGNSGAGLIRRPCETLDCGNAYADSREGTGAVSNRQEVNIAELQLRVFQHILRHGEQGAAVGQGAYLTVL